MFTDVNLNCAADYYYQVSAYNSFGESERAVWTKASTAACPVPAQPSNLNVSSTTEDSVSLNWQDNSADEDGFNIYRWDWNGVAWEFYYFASTPANATSFTDSGLSCDAQYFYFISAYNSYGESEHVDFVKGVTSACPANLPTPTESAQIPPTSTPIAAPVLPPTATATAIPTATATAMPTATVTPEPTAASKQPVFLPLILR